MLVLGIDTSSSTGSVSLVTAAPSTFAAEVVATATARVSNAHGESLLTLVAEVLARAHLDLAAVDLIAVGIGPGSFTGTRIGVATAKGLAFGAQKPLRGVDAFSALAADAGAGEGALVATILDARKAEVYVCLVEVTDDDLTCRTSPAHLPPEQVHGYYDDAGRVLAELVLAGDGVALVPGLRTPRRVGHQAPTASAVAAIAGARQLRAPLDEADLLEPLYVRPPDITMPATPPGMPGPRR